MSSEFHRSAVICLWNCYDFRPISHTSQHAMTVECYATAHTLNAVTEYEERIWNLSQAASVVGLVTSRYCCSSGGRFGTVRERFTFAVLEAKNVAVNLIVTATLSRYS